MFFFFLSLLIFSILNTLIHVKGQILNSAVDFSVRKHLWCVCPHTLVHYQLVMLVVHYQLPLWPVGL